MTIAPSAAASATAGLLASLDPEQRAAAMLPDGPAQVIAPAGSGKTTTLIARLGVLLGRGVAADRIGVVTFNRDAAAELTTRIASQLASHVPGAEAIEVRTLHAMARQVLIDAGRPARLVSDRLPLLRAARRRAVVTMHHVVDPGDVDAAFTETHRVRAPAPLARAGVATVQRSIRALADAVVVHEPSFAQVVPHARVIPHGIEVPARGDRAAARAELGVDGLCVLCFGFLAPYKGLEAALGAARLAGDHVQLVVAGGEHPRLAGDGYADRLRASAPPNARFAGYVPDADVARWFTAADIALLPYPQPFASSGPLALALAHGTPVLLSQALAGTTGAPHTLAVPPDPAQIAVRLRLLAADARQREALRSAAATLAAGRTWPEVAVRHLELYETPA
jgi:glycosyltransferase involved in cell wall biosynthesis